MPALSPIDLMKKPRRYSLTNLFFIVLMLIITFSFLAMGSYIVIRKIAAYRAEVKQLKIDFPVQQKRELNLRVLEAKEYIDWVSSYPDASLKKHLISLTRRYVGMLKQSNIASGNNLIILPERIQDSLDGVNRQTVIKVAVFNSNFNPVYVPKLNDVPDSAKRYKTLINKMLSPGITNKAAQEPNHATYYISSDGVGHAALYPSQDKGFWVMAVYAGIDDDRALQEIVLDSLSRVKF
ncbi:MAG TPA: hypothetical protein PLP88_09320, partial [Bacteroidales bacterium]|nr:hypothetical protein [Bacteroidales bacterium]